jgi:hypothetical protein
MANPGAAAIRAYEFPGLLRKEHELELLEVASADVAPARMKRFTTDPRSV